MGTPNPPWSFLWGIKKPKETLKWTRKKPWQKPYEGVYSEVPEGRSVRAAGRFYRSYLFLLLVLLLFLFLSPSPLQLRAPDLSGHLSGHCHPITVGSAGHQLRAPDLSGHCRTPTASSRSVAGGRREALEWTWARCHMICFRKMPENMSKHMIDTDMTDTMPEGMSENMPERMAKECQTETVKECQLICQKDC